LLFQFLSELLHIRINCTFTRAGERRTALLGWIEVDDLLLLGHRLNLDAAPLTVDADERLGEASVLVAGDRVLYVAHLCVIQAELVGPLVVHPVQAMELLDCTLVEDGFGLGMLEELVDGLGDEPDREVVVAVMSEHRL